MTPAALPAESHVCSCGCGRPAPLLVKWQLGVNMADGWYAVRCVPRLPEGEREGRAAA